MKTRKPFVKAFVFFIVLIKLISIIIINQQWCFNSFTQSCDSESLNLINLNNQNKKLTQKLPTSIIIGVAKCGTGTLLEFIAQHPNVAGDGYKDIHFFNIDSNYKRGLEWYRQQMPFSSDNQITIEKTPAYFRHSNTPKRVYAMNPKIKLVVIVCDPVRRAVSCYMQRKIGRYFPKLNLLLEKNLSDSENFRELFYDNLKVGWERECDVFPYGLYYDQIKNWLKYFALNQILIINGDQFRKEPSIAIEKLQSFLNLKQIIRRENFVFDESKGFFCLKNPTKESEFKCMSSSDGVNHKGRKHPEIDQAILNDVREKYYKSSNTNFFKLINVTSPWWPV